MKQLPMTWWTKPAHDFEGSLYRETCPACGALPFHWCRQENGARRGVPHAERRGSRAPAIPRGGAMVRIKEVKP